MKTSAKKTLRSWVMALLFIALFGYAAGILEDLQNSGLKELAILAAATTIVIALARTWYNNQNFPDSFYDENQDRA